ncbi:MAG: Maf family protein [Gemmataceae bacterium]
MEAAGHEFTVRPANVDEPTGEEFFESVHSGRKTPHGRGETDIRQFVQYVCWLKAAAVAPTITEGIVIAADTVSWIDGEVIGKPEDADDARRILRKLGGRDHELWTGTVLWRRPDDLQFAWQECSRVHFRNLTEEELDTYLATRKWEGCSGAYAIKDHDDPYVRVVEGSLSNVVGLPMETLEGVLKMALEK